MNSTSPSHRISIYFSYILRPSLEWRALHSQECFLPPRGGFNLRCTKVYHAKITVSTKNFPRSEGRKCGVKGLVQWRGLMVWSRSCHGYTDKGKGRKRD